MGHANPFTQTQTVGGSLEINSQHPMPSLEKLEKSQRLRACLLLFQNVRGKK